MVTEAATSQLSENTQERDLFELHYIRPTLAQATITIPTEVVTKLYEQAAKSQQLVAQAHGFNQGEIPLDYIKINFRENLIEHLKELLFKYATVNILYKEITARKLMVAGEPRLVDISLSPENDAQFTFDLTLFPELLIYDWKFFPFKAPKRKNYKDIDRQVETFIKEEKKQLDEFVDDGLTIGDWVNFNLSFANEHNGIICDNFEQNFWFRLGDEEIESPLREIFLGKKVNETFYTRNQALQHFFSDQLDTNYNFCIEICDVLPHTYFCLEQFKKQFRIKTNKDMHRKLIEVFSYRNDLSQRRAMVEEALKLLLSKHRFPVPNHLILRQKKVILEVVQDNPDYNVYRVQKDFGHRIRQLAEKQVKEAIIIDRLAYHENISITNQDIKNYLNLTNRHRMKEFIYFTMPSFKIQGQEVPIPCEELKRTCMREKAINHVIYHLMKN